MAVHAGQWPSNQRKPELTEPQPKPLAQRVRESEARSIDAGAVRMPGGLLPADAAAALNELVETGYAASKTAVIAKALLAVRKRPKK